MNKHKGWPERKQYIRHLHRNVAYKHHKAATKHRRYNRPAQLNNFDSLRRYRPYEKESVPINWLQDTNVSKFDETIHNNTGNYEAQIVYLTPDYLLKMQKDSGINRKSVEQIKKEIEEGKPIHSFALEFNKEGKFTSYQENRHRIVALKELGITKVPVWLMKKRN